jgi:hypothetical protein
MLGDFDADNARLDVPATGPSAKAARAGTASVCIPDKCRPARSTVIVLQWKKLRVIPTTGGCFDITDRADVN